ncbi:MAG TPA: beta-galactosidase [Tepidisphaeraceae bacterium]|nr:beta-galactosidase [Tepidisphaeraceae bacterium]
MKIGTYYYPEQWPREQWQRDFDNIVAMGLQIVHMAEFAWFSMEPRPGEFKFDWLDECMEMAAKRKLDVILCTPTAAPPVWLAEKHPETLLIDKNRTNTRFGGRRHYNPTSPKFREATARIVSAMAERYGKHPSIIGWQLDNEYSAEHDQSENTHVAFRGWLQRKYETIEKLNHAWGNQFWNTYYTDFKQILLPPSFDPGYANPHHHLDGQRFWSWAFADYNKLQADILKPHIGNRFITTNFMHLHPSCDPGDMENDLTLYSWDTYPVTGWEKNPKDEAYRVADPSSVSMLHDLMASYHDRWALMEIQPGQVNWSGVPVLVHPGAVRLWLWTAIAHGAEFITVYRFRQPRFGIELFHHALVGTDGVTPSPGGREFVQVIDEVKRLKAPAAEPLAKSDSPSAGLLLDFDQLWYFNTLPQARRWDQKQWLTQWYQAIARLGLRVQIVHPNKPWPKDLSMVVAPGVQMVNDKLIKQFDDYAAGGGNLVLTCRTGLMDRHGQLFEGPVGKPILPLIGGTIEAYDGLPADTFGQVDLDGTKHKWGVWGDLLYAEPSSKVLAKYADQFYAGAAAALHRKHGKGTVSYCGVYAEPSFTDAFLEKVAALTRTPVMKLPNRVQVIKRGKHWIALNYQLVPFDAPATKGAKFLVGSRKVDPVGVSVWEE